jgi:hypothetical protein
VRAKHRLRMGPGTLDWTMGMGMDMDMDMDKGLRTMDFLFARHSG